VRIQSLFPVRLWMRLAWEWRARRNALHYVADFRDRWDDLDAFFETGRDDAEAFLAAAGWTGTEKATLLEIGCGVGRMSRHLATRFASVTGVDVSPTMVREARRLNSDIPNLGFSECSGVDLRGIPDAAFDYAMSYIVFQHVPEEEVVLGYLRETLRVLKPGGRFRFQARNDFKHLVSGTYHGASVRVPVVRAVARSCGRDLLSVEGEGTAMCYFEVG
jgi:ubiquinone/menaquinone biosynthesis C-methylase UbiE